MSVVVFTLVVFGTSIGAGLLGALLGLGGGIIVIPVLTLGLGVALPVASGASLVSVIATSSASAAVYVRDKLTNIRLGMVLETATTVGALAGALLVTVVSRSFLYILFAVMLTISAVSVYQRGQAERGAPPPPPEPDQASKALRLEGSYHDASLGREVPYAARSLPWGLGVSLVAGTIAGLLGVGGGPLQVAVMQGPMRLPLKVSSATSNFMIGVTAATGALIYFARGQINPIVAAPVALGVLLGATVGTKLLGRTPVRTLRLIFIPLLLYTAIQMLGRGLGVTIP